MGKRKKEASHEKKIKKQNEKITKIKIKIN